MSDTAIATICSCAIQAVIGILGFLTLWVKLKYGMEPKAESLAKKLDANTLVTTETKEAVSNGGLSAYDARFNEHDVRIAAVEAALDTVSKNVDSTRHEMRSTFQSVISKLDLMAIRKQ